MLTPYNSAYFCKMSIASFTVLFTGLTSKLGWNMSCSSIFLSNKSLTCDKSNFAVVKMSSASCFFGEFYNSFSTDVAKLIIHFNGVTISCVTVDVSKLSNLLAA